MDQDKDSAKDLSNEDEGLLFEKSVKSMSKGKRKSTPWTDSDSDAVSGFLMSLHCILAAAPGLS